MNNADKIREFLIEEIEKDAIGPLMGEDEEWLEWEKPQTRYFSGVLYPKKTPFKSDDHLKNTNGESGKDDDEDDEASSFSIAVGTKPSSLGLTCQISEEVEKIKVDIDFGKYDPIKRPKKSEKKKDDTKTESEIDENPAWKRRQVHADFTLEIKDAPGGYHEIKDEYAQVQFKISKIKNKRRTISIFLMNIRPPIPDDEYIQDNMCIFQPFIWVQPTVYEWFLMFAMGFVATVGHFLIILSFRLLDLL